jgi:hypothetical protein
VVTVLQSTEFDLTGYGHFKNSSYTLQLNYLLFMEWGSAGVAASSQNIANAWVRGEML